METRFDAGDVCAIQLANGWQIVPFIRYCGTEFFLEACHPDGHWITFHNLWKPYCVDIYDDDEEIGNLIGAKYLQLEHELVSAIRPDLEAMGRDITPNDMHSLAERYQARYPEHIAYTYFVVDTRCYAEIHVLVRDPYKFMDITRRVQSETVPAIDVLLDFLGADESEVACQ